jgi:hypothetical protein
MTKKEYKYKYIDIYRAFLWIRCQSGLWSFLHLTPADLSGVEISSGNESWKKGCAVRRTAQRRQSPVIKHFKKITGQGGPCENAPPTPKGVAELWLKACRGGLFVWRYEVRPRPRSRITKRPRAAGGLRHCRLIQRLQETAATGLSALGLSKYNYWHGDNSALPERVCGYSNAFTKKPVAVFSCLVETTLQ